MPFTVKDFPGQRFDSLEEYQEARKRRDNIEQTMEARAKHTSPPLMVQIIPAHASLVQQRLIELEKRICELDALVSDWKPNKTLEPRKPGENVDGIKIDTILYGVTKGKQFTLQVLAENYLCSDGEIYPTLSAAALGVSGNRRSGWKFWTDEAGVPIGALTGRFKLAQNSVG